jgi:hypothetical protein
MTPDTFHSALRTAEALDALRAIPRLFVTALFFLYVIFVVAYFNWLVEILYPDMKSGAVTLEQFLAAAGIPGSILTAIGEMLRRVWQNYTSGGRNWTDAPAPKVPSCDSCGRPLS